MALEDITPAVRTEEILDGADIEPATRLEYFMKKAANEVPKPAGSSDAGKVVTVNAAGSAYELTTPSGGGGEVVTLTFQNTSGGVVVNHYTSSKTYAEILALVTAGVPIIVRYSNLDDSGNELPNTVRYVPYSAVAPGRYVEFSVCAPDPIDGTSVTIEYCSIFYLAQAVPEFAPEAIHYEAFEVTATID